jgi:mono/diheme cytochrome c family protein
VRTAGARRAIRFAAVPVAFALAAAARVSAHDPITTRVTWSREISRIVASHCTGCHIAGGAAPMPLSTYAEVKPWARAIRDAVVSRRMPPWPASHAFGDFINDPSLSPFEISLVASWVDGGQPVGRPFDAVDLQRRVDLPRGRRVVVKFPRRASAPMGQIVDVAGRVALDRPSWIGAWQFVPGDGAIRQAEFAAGEARTSSPFDRWTPADRVVSFPAGTARALPAQASITARLWLRSAQMQQDFPLARPSRAPELTMWLLDAAPARAIDTVAVACGSTAPAVDGEIVSVRSATTSVVSRIALALSSASMAPVPVVLARDVQPGYQPSFRLREPLPIALGSQFDTTTSSAGDCRVLVDVARGRAIPGVTRTPRLRESP